MTTATSMSFNANITTDSISDIAKKDVQHTESNVGLRQVADRKKWTHTSPSSATYKRRRRDLVSLQTKQTSTQKAYIS